MNKKKSVTISDIAKRVNMTTITVSRALSKPDLVKPATLARILEVARELDYVPNAFARGLKRSESLIIGVITASVLVRGSALREAAAVADRLADEGMTRVFLVTR